MAAATTGGVMEVFLFLALFPAFAVFLGVKALFPPGIQLLEGRTLSRKTSMIIGIATIALSMVIVGALFAYIVLRIPII